MDKIPIGRRMTMRSDGGDGDIVGRRAEMGDIVFFRDFLGSGHCAPRESLGGVSQRSFVGLALKWERNF